VRVVSQARVTSHVGFGAEEAALQAWGDRMANSVTAMNSIGCARLRRHARQTVLSHFYLVANKCEGRSTEAPKQKSEGDSPFLR